MQQTAEFSPPSSTKEPLTPVQETKTHSFPTFLVVILILLIILAGAVGYYVGLQQGRSVDILPEPDSTSLITTPSPSATPIKTAIENTPQGNYYENLEFGIRFPLNAGERMIECVNKNDNTDEIALRVTTRPVLSSNFPECTTEGSFDDISISKRSQGPQSLTTFLTLMQGPGYNYSIENREIQIFGNYATLVSGVRDTSEPAPLPNTLNVILIEHDSKFYVIPEIYADREIDIF